MAFGFSPIGSVSSTGMMMLRILFVLLPSYNALAKENHGLVATTPFVNLRNGTEGILPCNVTAPKLENVYWFRGSSLLEADELIGLELPLNPGVKRGPGFEDGSFDITYDFSLIIKDVTFRDSTQYFCSTFDFESNKHFWDSTNVTVYVPPTEPFPFFEECLMNSSGQNNKHNCTIATRLPEINLTCSVAGYYPDFKINIRNKTHVYEALERKLFENVDGTRNMSVTIRALPAVDAYECVASGIGPSGKMSEKLITILLYWIPEDITPKTQLGLLERYIIIVASVMAVCCIAAYIIWMVWKSRRHRFTEENPGYIELRGIITAEEIEHLCKNDLNRHYSEVLSQITNSPLDPESTRNMNDMYTNLFILNLEDRFSRREGINNTKRKLLPSEFKTLLSSGPASKRILLVGEDSVGKTAFLSKLVNDWMTGLDELQTTKLLFYIPLAEAERHESFSKCIEKYLCSAKGCLPRLDDYITRNQSKVMFLLDGLNEYEGDINQHDPDNALNQIIRGEMYKESVVVVTSRPLHANEIVGNEKLNKLFTCVRIEGFDEQSAEKYISMFFHDDVTSAKSFYEFLHDDQRVGGFFSTMISTFPIYLAIFCHTWRDTSRQKFLLNYETVSDLMHEVIITLKERFISKTSEQEQHASMQNIDSSFEKLGKLAYDGILANSLVLNAGTPDHYADSICIAQKFGVLTSEKRLAPMHLQQQESKQYVTTYRFPQKLFQDYLAAVFVSSLSPQKSAFEMVLLELLSRSIGDLDKFRYLWYFIVTRGKNTGMATMKFLMRNIKSTNFIIRVAYECHEKEIVTDIINKLFTKRSVQLKKKQIFALHLFILSMRTSLDVLFIRVLPENKILARKAARTIFALERLSVVYISDCGIYNDEFYASMCETSSQTCSYIKTLIHYKGSLGASAAMNFASAICLMTSLRVLQLEKVEVDSVFFETMSQKSQQCQIETLIIGNEEMHLDPSASSDLACSILSMPNLKNIRLVFGSLDKMFYQALADRGNEVQIEKISLGPCMPLGLDASIKLMTGLSSMVNLNTVILLTEPLDDAGFSVLSQNSPVTKIERLHLGGTVKSTNASRDLFSCMPRLKSLRLSRPGHGLPDVVCSLKKNLTPEMKLRTIILSKAKLTSRDLRALLALRTLRTVRFIQVTAQDVDITFDEDADSDEQTDNPSTDSDTNQCSEEDPNVNSEYPVKEIRMDEVSLRHLLQLGLHTQSPKVERVQLDFTQDIAHDVMETLQGFSSSLTKLYLTAMPEYSQSLCKKSVNLIGTSDFCNVVESFHGLVTLRITDISIGNENTREILQMIGNHSHLENVVMIRCGTTDSLNSLCDETVRMSHGKPFTSTNWNDDLYTDYLRNLEKARFDDDFVVMSEEKD